MKYLTFLLVLCTLSSVLHALPHHSNGKTNAMSSEDSKVKEKTPLTDTAMIEALDPCFNCGLTCTLLVLENGGSLSTIHLRILECGDERCPSCSG